MLFHRISPVDVQPGDHLYRWRYFKIIQGIAIEQNDGNTVTIFVVIPNEMNSFRLISLREFQGRGYLRRVLYNQGDSYLHPIKLSGTSFIDEKRPAEEVVRNALLLVNSNINPQFMQQLLTPGTSNFARLCCTMPHEQWRTYLQANGEKIMRRDFVLDKNEKFFSRLYAHSRKHSCRSIGSSFASFRRAI